MVVSLKGPNWKGLREIVRRCKPDARRKESDTGENLLCRGLSRRITSFVAPSRRRLWRNVPLRNLEALPDPPGPPFPHKPSLSPPPPARLFTFQNEETHSAADYVSNTLCRSSFSDARVECSLKAAMAHTHKTDSQSSA